MATVTQVQAWLVQHGFDAATVQEHGIEPLVAHAAKLGAPVDPWLDALERYVLTISKRTQSLWSPLRFVVAPLAQCAGADAAHFDSLLQSCATLLEHVKDNVTRTEQYGLGEAARALRNRPGDLLAVLSVASTLAVKGNDPGWYLQLVVPPLANARHFAASLARHVRLFDALMKRSVFIGFQVATGLAAIAKVEPDEASQPWLEVLARLPNPGTVFEHGVHCLLAAAPTPALVTRALELALELTDRSIEPLPMLRAQVLDDAALDIAAQLVGAGIEPSLAIGNGLRAFERLGLNDADRLVALSKSLKASGLTQRVFEEAILQTAEMEERFGLGLKTLELIELLAQKGFEPTLTVSFGLGRALTDVERFPFLAQAALEVAFTLAQAGIAPDAALSYAIRPLAQLSGGNQPEFHRLRAALESLIISLHSMGLDPGNVLFHDVRGLIEVGSESAIFIELGSQLQHLMKVWVDAKLDPVPLVQTAFPSALRAAVNRPWVLTAAIEVVERLVKEGRSASALALLTDGLSSASLSFGADEKGLRTVLSTLEKHTQGLSAELINPVSAAACIVAKRDVDLLAALLDVMVSKLMRADLTPEVRLCVGRSLPVLVPLVTTVESLQTLLDATLASTARVAPTHHEVWLSGALEAASLLPFDDALAAMREQLRFSEHPDVLAQAPAVALLAKDAQGLMAGLERLASSLKTLEDRSTFSFAIGVALKATDVSGLASRLDVLEPLLKNSDDASRLMSGLRRIEPTLARLPAAWHSLVRPLLTAHKDRAGTLLMTIGGLGSRLLTTEADCDVLREVVTQLGVRSLDALQSLIVPALYSGVLPTLASHASLLRGYLRDVGFHSPDIYSKYVELQKDAALSEGERKKRTMALREHIEQLSQSVRSGELSAAQLDDPLLGVAVLRLFPPAVTATQQMAVSLIRASADRPDDVRRWPGPAMVKLEVPSGGHRFRPGYTLDLKPWALAHELLNGLPPREHTTDAALGWALLRSWADGQIARAASKRVLLAELLHSFASAAPPAPLDSPSQLLAVRDLLADQCFERIERVLLAARAADETTYFRLIEGRLAPKTVLSAKLLTSLSATINRWRGGLGDDEAKGRLKAQVPGLVLDDAVFTSLRRADSDEEVLRTLSSAKPKTFKLEAGKEVQRIHGELFGQELHAMQQALFGHEGQLGALEYHEAAASLSLTVEVTKRQAHAPVGFAEGVCVTGDQRLWNRPEFLQAIVWNSEGVAEGGMHLLVVEEQGKRYLTLPGINPSSGLLDEVEPSRLVTALISAAKTLAAQWQLEGVWLPEAPSILSNRHAVYSAVAKLGLPVRTTAVHPFSFSPFAYSFASVWVA